ncbi:MAG: TatD DNase family protein [Cognaticolwellia sp.]|jgi:TatD DNase family protein
MTSKATEFIDIGVNLAGRQFRHDWPAVVQQAQAQGVAQILITGTDVVTSQAGSAMALKHSGVLFSTAGIHPHRATDCSPEALNTLRELARESHVVAIGECGLDFNRMFSPQDAQETAFHQQLELAAELGMPVFLHERDAFSRFADILAQWRPKLPGAVVHCFTGERKDMERYLELDCHIGVTGWVCDERRGAGLAELVPEIPDERLLIETDAPWLTPRTLKPRPKRNLPEYLPHIAERIAELRGQSVEHVAQVSTENARRLFGMPD